MDEKAEPFRKVRYSAFSSHATDPDGELVRRVKSALEGFHTRAGVKERFAEISDGAKLLPILVCVDGLDFVFPKVDSTSHQPIEELVKHYLERSDSLLVFSGTQTLNHPWINKEIEWFKELCPEAPVYFILTHGPDPKVGPDFIPPALLEDRDMSSQLFFDLRGFYVRNSPLQVFRQSSILRLQRSSRRMRRLLSGSRSWESVRGFDEALNRLAARLISDCSEQDLAVEHLQKSFETARRKSRAKRMATNAGLLSVAAAAIIGLFASIENLAEEQTRRTNRIWVQQADLLRQDLNASLIESLSYSVNSLANGNTDDASRSLVQTMQRLVKTEHLYTVPSGPETYVSGQRVGQVEKILPIESGAVLAIGGFDSYLTLFDSVNRVVLDELYLDAGRIQAIEPVIDSDHLGVATQKGLHIVKMNRTKGPPLSWSLERVASRLNDERLFDVAYHKNSGNVITGTLEGELLAFGWNGSQLDKEGSLLYTLLDQDNLDESDLPMVGASIFGLALRQTESGTRLFMSSLSHLVVAVDLFLDHVTEAWMYKHDDSLYAMDASEDGLVVIATDSNGSIVILDGDTGDHVRDVYSYQLDPGLTRLSIDGTLATARPDTLANIGLDLHPSGRYFAVSSHDRTTKYFEIDRGSAVAASIHDRQVRDVTFDPNGKTAYSYSDDGAIQRSMPFDSYETLRRGGVDRTYVLEEDNSAVLVDPDEKIYIWTLDHEDPVRGVSNLPKNISRFTDVPELPDHFVLYDKDRQKHYAYVISAGNASASPLCEGESIDDILSLSSDQSIIKVLHGRATGETLMVVKNLSGDEYGLKYFNIDTCESVTFDVEYHLQDEINAVTGEAVLGVQATPYSIDIWLSESAEADGIQFDHDIKSFAAANQGKSVAAVLSTTDDQTSRDSLCLCKQFHSIERWVRNAISDKHCRVKSSKYACDTVALPKAISDGLLQNVSAPWNGHNIIVRTGNAEVGVIQEASTIFGESAFVKLSDSQNRRVLPPYRFNRDGSLLGIPAGDTGLRILETENWKTLSTLPTPGRLYHLNFLEDQIVSIDGANEDSILRIQPWRKDDLIRQSCQYWPASTVPRVRTGIPTLLPRQSFCP